jgi:hypothetical protein
MILIGCEGLGKNVNSRGHNLDTRFEQLFPEIKHPPGPQNPVTETISARLIAQWEAWKKRILGLTIVQQ